jgi:GDP-L-fucose synthase
MSFWENKKIIVTGGNGFLGTYVVNKLEARGAGEIFIPRSSKYDLRDVGAIRTMLSEIRPDIVIHLAARVGGIGANMAHPAEFFYDNLMMGVQLLHESWVAGVSKFVGIGTVCAYPADTPVPFKEEDFWEGYPEPTNAPYGLAKKMLLVESQAYREQYGYNSIFLVPVNLYGPRDNFDLETSHVIPALIRKCLEAVEGGAQELEVWGDGSPTREFLYAEDAAEGILLATEFYNSSDPVNLGNEYEVSIRDLVEMIANLTGFQGDLNWDSSRPNGQMRRKLDVSRANNQFGFRSQTTLEDGLRKTIEFYKQAR